LAGNFAKHHFPEKLENGLEQRLDGILIPEIFMKTLVVTLTIALAAPVVFALDLPKPPAPPQPPIGLPNPPTAPGDFRTPPSPSEVKPSKSKRHPQKYPAKKKHKKGK
jgi:hypothetical protein